MSFIDLMADYDWSDADIKNRTEAMIATVFPPVDAAILSRKVDGTRYGYVLTPDEQAQLTLYQQVAAQAGQAADAARADMALLRKVWAVERGELAPEAADVDTMNRVTLRGRFTTNP